MPSIGLLLTTLRFREKLCLSIVSILVLRNIIITEHDIITFNVLKRPGLLTMDRRPGIFMILSITRKKILCGHRQYHEICPPVKFKIIIMSSVPFLHATICAHVDIG